MKLKIRENCHSKTTRVSIKTTSVKQTIIEQIFFVALKKKTLIISLFLIPDTFRHYWCFLFLPQTLVLFLIKKRVLHLINEKSSDKTEDDTKRGSRKFKKSFFDKSFFCVLRSKFYVPFSCGGDGLDSTLDELSLLTGGIWRFTEYSYRPCNPFTA